MKPLKLSGIGLRKEHFTDFLSQKPPVAWVEIHAENYMGEGGASLEVIDTISKDYPISLHGVGLSLGSADELNWQHLKQLRDLVKRTQPCLISDHLAWSSVQGQYLHELLPLPHTDEVIQHVSNKIGIVQDYLQQAVLIENIAHYFLPPGDIPAVEFMQAIAKQSGCKILFDISNLYINSENLNFNAIDYLTQLEANLIDEIHLGGFSLTEIAAKKIFIDSHNNVIDEKVWALFKTAITLFGVKPTIIEWDDQLPDLTTLCQEAHYAETIMRQTHATRPMAV